MTTLHEFIAESNNIEMLRELLNRGENPDSQDQDGQTPLHMVVLKCESNPEQICELLLVARELISFGADVNLSNNLSKTPLQFAVGCRNYRMIDLLLHHNANMNQQDYEGCTALHFAVSRRRFYGKEYNLDPGIVKLLLKYNPGIDMQTRNGKTALILAVQMKNFLIVKMLLNKKAAVYLQDLDGHSALHYALHSQEVDVDIVLELVRHGGSFTMTNNIGRSSMSLYFMRLKSAPITELEKAKFVFKLYLLDGNEFNVMEQYLIKEMSRKMKFSLKRYVFLCSKEIKQMKSDKLSPFSSVYDMALRGVYHSGSDNDHVPFEFFDKVLKKLLICQYPFYRDLIVAGICRPYLNKEFAEWCNFVKMDNMFLNFDVLFCLSSYLSNFDMLNMMIACTGGWKRYWYLPRFIYSTRCIIS